MTFTGLSVIMTLLSNLKNRQLNRAVRNIDRAATPEDARIATMGVMLAQFKRKNDLELNATSAQDMFDRVRPLLQQHGQSADAALGQLQRHMQRADTSYKTNVDQVRRALCKRVFQALGVGFVAGTLVGAFIGCIIMCPPAIAVGVGVGMLVLPAVADMAIACFQRPFKRARLQLARELAEAPVPGEQTQTPYDEVA